MIIRRVSGKSMMPSLKPGQIVIARKVRGTVKPDDVIILKHDVEKIKRVKKVTPEGILVLGDNLDSSTDSRQFGLVKREEIIAKLVWPRPVY